MANRVEVIVGTYEEFLLGYKVGYSKDGKVSLSQSFATRSHVGSIKCVAASGKYLASGGADDRIILYDMLSRKEIQILMHHDGSVNALAFTPGATHILSGGDDGKLAAVRTNTWQMEAVWNKAHSGAAVTCISCHPSGKLALSLGNDLTLRTWNLIKGRLAYTTNLKNRDSLGKVAEAISWAPNGKLFTLTGARIVEIWKIENAAILKKQICESKPTCVCWVSETNLIVGFDNGKVMLMSIDENNEQTFHQVHKQRVKAVAYANGVLATASSSGEVTLWNLDLEENSLEQICSTNIGCRPTCLALIDLSQFDEDYILKREENPTEAKVSEKTAKTKEQILPTGTVVVEYEDLEQDLRLLEKQDNVGVEGKASKNSKVGLVVNDCKADANIDLQQTSEGWTETLADANIDLQQASEGWIETPVEFDKDHNMEKNQKQKKKKKKPKGPYVRPRKKKKRSLS